MLPRRKYDRAGVVKARPRHPRAPPDLLRRQAHRPRAELRDIDPTDLPAVLAHHLHAQLAGAPAAISDPAARLVLSEKVLTLLATETGDAAFHEQNLAPPRRPSTPLTTSTLVTRDRFEATLAHKIACEVASADSVDLLAAFITVSGVRSVRDALESLARRRARLRVLTTVFTGTTEIAALDTLARLPGGRGAHLFDARRTRLHAKAWLFQRDAGLH